MSEQNGAAGAHTEFAAGQRVRRSGPVEGMPVHYVAHQLVNHRRTHLAFITQVLTPDCVNLKVFFDQGPIENRADVGYDPDGAPGTFHEINGPIDEPTTREALAELQAKPLVKP